MGTPGNEGMKGLAAGHAHALPAAPTPLFNWSSALGVTAVGTLLRSPRGERADPVEGAAFEGVREGVAGSGQGVSLQPRRTNNGEQQTIQEKKKLMRSIPHDSSLLGIPPRRVWFPQSLAALGRTQPGWAEEEGEVHRATQQAGGGRLGTEQRGDRGGKPRSSGPPPPLCWAAGAGTPLLPLLVSV